MVIVLLSFVLLDPIKIYEMKIGILESIRLKTVRLGNLKSILSDYDCYFG